MTYFYKKIISNKVIYEIEKLISEGKTYKEIKLIHNVSDGTIARIKQGKIKSNRAVVENIELVSINEIEQIKKELIEARKVIVEQQGVILKYKYNSQPNENEVYKMLNEIELNKESAAKFKATEFGSKYFKAMINKFGYELKISKDENKILKNEIEKLKNELQEVKQKEIKEVKTNDIKPINSFTGLKRLSLDDC